MRMGETGNKQVSLTGCPTKPWSQSCPEGLWLPPLLSKQLLLGLRVETGLAGFSSQCTQLHALISHTGNWLDCMALLAYFINIEGGECCPLKEEIEGWTWKPKQDWDLESEPCSAQSTIDICGLKQLVMEVIVNTLLNTVGSLTEIHNFSTLQKLKLYINFMAQLSRKSPHQSTTESRVGGHAGQCEESRSKENNRIPRQISTRGQFTDLAAANPDLLQNAESTGSCSQPWCSD